MEKITGNEEAFPRTSTGHLDSFVEGAVGLTIRQHFAAMAMQGILANNEGAMTSSSSRSFHPDTIAEYAVICAGALISELNKEKP